MEYSANKDSIERSELMLYFNASELPNVFKLSTTPNFTWRRVIELTAMLQKVMSDIRDSPHRRIACGGTIIQNKYFNETKTHETHHGLDGG